MLRVGRGALNGGEEPERNLYKKKMFLKVMILREKLAEHDRKADT